jgi:hypothetical protein
MKFSGFLIWVVILVVFSIVKNMAKKTENNKTVRGQPDNQGGRDSIQDFFNQLNGGATTARSTQNRDSGSNENALSQKAKSVEDFFKTTNTAPKENIQPKRRVRVVQPSIVKKEEIEQTFVPQPKVIEPTSYDIEYNHGTEDTDDKFNSEVGRAYTLGKENAIQDFGHMIDSELDEKHLKHAVIWAEILKKPRALKPWN